MKTNPSNAIVLRHCLRTAAFLFLAALLPAQTIQLGTIEGRVSNAETGNYLELVQITVVGTTLEAFSDAGGYYRLDRVPAGEVTVKAYRTGATPRNVTVTVASGQTVQQDMTLSLLGVSSDTLVMEKMVVTTPREMAGAAIAINTKRYAPNMVNVIAADEFGPMATGNVGEALKFVPGISLTQGGMGEANTISLGGAPSANVPVTFNGFDFGSAGTGTTRTIGIHQVSLNNISRVEISFTPTPETPGMALAGTVNMVPKNSFELSKPIYTASASLLARSTSLTLGETPSGRDGPQHTVLPGYDFAAIVPVNKHFGFTFTAASSPMYTPLALLQSTWRGASASTNGTTFPNTTPDQPYLTVFSVRDAVRFTRHTAYATTIDYRFSQNDTITFTLNYALFSWESNDRQINFTINKVLPGDFSPTYTHGAPGTGAGALLMFDAAQNVNDELYMPTLTYRHYGPTWRIEAGAGLSHSVRERRDLSDGLFANAIAQRPNVSISFDDIQYDGPRSITVKDGVSGAVLDPYKLSTYQLLQGTGNEIDFLDQRRSAYANVQRNLSFRIPVVLKAGIDLREQTKDVRADVPVFPYVGANKDASQVLDESFSQRDGPFWFGPIEWMSNKEMATLSHNDPSLFGPANEVNRHNTLTAQSKYARELITSAYIRGDVTLMNGKLKIVGGVRFEQTNVEGQGDLIDLTRNFQRTPSGEVIYGPNGQPLPITTDPLEAALLTHVERGLVAKKEYFRQFPSLNASYVWRENNIARAGYFRSIGRPDFVQYAGSLTLPNTENPPSATNLITVNNAGIKPWMADSFVISLEHYFGKVGLISIGGYFRNYQNMFGPTVTSTTPEFLSLYSLDEETYGPYSVATQSNLPGKVQMSGFEFNYKQALTFLPVWARGVQVFANFNTQHLEGEGADNFAGTLPLYGNFGISLSRPKYALRARWNYRDRSRQAPVASGSSIEPGTYFWGADRLVTDVSAEYNFAKHFTLYANVTNLADSAIDTEVFGPSTPRNASFNGRMQYGALWLFGVRATF